MTDSFSILPLNDLLAIILRQYDNNRIIWGIPEDLFFKPESYKALSIKRFRKIT